MLAFCFVYLHALFSPEYDLNREHSDGSLSCAAGYSGRFCQGEGKDFIPQEREYPRRSLPVN